MRDIKSKTWKSLDKRVGLNKAKEAKLTFYQNAKSSEEEEILEK